MRRTAELDRVDRLMMVAYGSPSRRRELELYLDVQRDGWFVIADRDEIVAAAGAIAYGSFCWLGLVATDPARRRQGLATRLSAHLVDWACERGCTTVALDASEEGRPVYERLGFQPLGFTLELSPPEAISDNQPSRAVRRKEPEPVDDVLELDRHAFGGDRTTLLRGLVQDDRCRCYVLHDAEELAGYLFARERLLGPGLC